MEKVALEEGEKVEIVIRKSSKNILDIVKKFVDEIDLNKVKEDSLKYLLKMRERL